MQKILIILGAEQRDVAPGRFNASMVDVAIQILKHNAEIQITRVANDYDIHEEQQKILWADVIIFQFPVYWFSAPSKLKRYFDDVYAHGLFFGNAQRYGDGGFLTEKKYMLSTTWNAPETSFQSGEGLFGEVSPDEVLAAVHLTQQYIGMKCIPSFHAMNIIQQPDFEAWASRYKDHLTKYIF